MAEAADNGDRIRRRIVCAKDLWDFRTDDRGSEHAWSRGEEETNMRPVIWPLNVVGGSGLTGAARLQCFRMATAHIASRKREEHQMEARQVFSCPSSSRVSNIPGVAVVVPERKEDILG